MTFTLSWLLLSLWLPMIQTQHNDVLYYNVTEESLIGTAIGDLVNDSGLQGIYTEEVETTSWL